MIPTFAVYAESTGGYVHLVSATSETEVFELLLEDVKSVGEKIGHLFNVYACKGSQEYPDLEDLVNKYIKENQ